MPAKNNPIRARISRLFGPALSPPKFCPKCGKTKPAGDFKHRHGGTLHSWCKACEGEYARLKIKITRLREAELAAKQARLDARVAEAKAAKWQRQCQRLLAKVQEDRVKLREFGEE